MSTPKTAAHHYGFLMLSPEQHAYLRSVLEREAASEALAILDDAENYMAALVRDSAALDWTNRADGRVKH
jgi:hypothetical protein